MEWRVLVVDDKQADDVKELINGNKVLTAPDNIYCETCSDFSDAIKRLREQRFDLMVLDLKNDEEPDDDGTAYAGERVYAEVKETRFIPIIFHTGFAYKVESLASPFVKVVTRDGNPAALRGAIRQVFESKLPALVRHIEEEQRKYMWESAEKIWSDDLAKDNSSDLAYLLSRRLANLLKGSLVRSYFTTNGNVNDAPKPNAIHAIELYIWPPLPIPELMFGDILSRKIDDTDASEFYVVLTPTCDCVQNNAEFILLSKCSLLHDTDVWKKIQEALDKKNVPSNNVKSELMALLRDNSKPADRRQYLPRTSFLPDLLVDFQVVTHIPRSDLLGEQTKYTRIASLDNPYAEELQAKMIRYYGRVGTPDLDVDLIYERLIKAA
jgi:CheY-like chemotaxis protein